MCICIYAKMRMLGGPWVAGGCLLASLWGSIGLPVGLEALRRYACRPVGSCCWSGSCVHAVGGLHQHLFLGLQKFLKGEELLPIQSSSISNCFLFEWPPSNLQIDGLEIVKPCVPRSPGSWLNHEVYAVSSHLIPNRLVRCEKSRMPKARTSSLQSPPVPCRPGIPLNNREALQQYVPPCLTLRQR